MGNGKLGNGKWEMESLEMGKGKTRGYSPTDSGGLKEIPEARVPICVR